MASMLKSKLDSGRFALTAEVVPPLSADPEDLLKIARPLKGLADAVNITDGASARAHIDVMVGARLLHDIGVEPILQLTCRDRNRIALQSLLIGAAALDLTNILVLTGDDPKKGDQPDAKPVFDLDSTALMATAVSIRDEHQLPHGRKVKGPIDYFLGVADSPIDPAPGWAPTGLAKKVAAGAQFAQTQFCMDAGVVRRYLARLAEHGLAGKIKFLIGVAPLASAKSASWIRENLFGSIIPDAIVERLEKAADPKAEGAKICIEYIQQLAEIPGVSGAHVMAPLNEKAVPEVLTNARKALA